ncbi:MAG: DUF1178 family protein [Rhodospirillales bacterium]|nr:DUF1178 family protein [Rhodospirillales bacterium]
MILFDLICEAGHRFESWFQSGGAFDRQQAEHVIECPICGTSTITKAPMAPRVARSGLVRRESDGDLPAESSPQAALPTQILEAMRLMRQHIEENCDYVGRDFSEEARRIHYGEVAQHDIYGEASSEDARELIEEGIRVSCVPWFVRRDD